MAELAFHEVADLFPLLEGDDLETLAEDIKQNGLQIPIELFEGKILDGRNRQTACLLAGIAPDYVEVDPDDPVEYVLSMNLHRRHLNESQRAMVGDAAKDHHAKLAKERQKAGGGDKRSSKAKESVPETLPEPNSGDSRDQAGAAVGVSGKLIDAAGKVRGKKGSKALQDAVTSGKLPVSSAAKLVHLPKAEQTRIAKSENPAAEARKAAVTPQKPKPPYPVFEHFLDMLSNITFFMGKIEEDYKSLTGFVKHKDWNSKRTTEAAGFLRAVTEGIVEFNQEMEKLCPRK